MGLNAPNWNQRTCSSRKAESATPAGKRGAEMKAPMSVFQYGNPAADVFSPPAIWLRKTPQLDQMSPGQSVVAYRCCPANAERVRMTTRFADVVARWWS